MTRDAGGVGPGVGSEGRALIACSLFKALGARSGWPSCARRGSGRPMGERTVFRGRTGLTRSEIAYNPYRTTTGPLEDEVPCQIALKGVFSALLILLEMSPSRSR